MRRVLITFAAVLLPTAPLLAVGNSSHLEHRQLAALTRTASSCSVSNGCVAGCAIEVASHPAPGHLPTSPCTHASAARPCTEYVAGVATVPGPQRCRRFPDRILRQGKRATPKTRR